MSQNNGILMLVYQDDSETLKLARRDAAILLPLAPDTQRLGAKTITQLVNIIEKVRPSVLYLFADFDAKGMLYDRENRSISLAQLMQRSEALGVSLFFIANEIPSDILSQNIKPPTRAMIFAAMLDRNEHFHGWLEKLFRETVHTGDFIRAYIKLAPQVSQIQNRMPLPGSVVIPPQG